VAVILVEELPDPDATDERSVAVWSRAPSPPYLIMGRPRLPGIVDDD
jgi:hypothetical protein